MPFPSDVRVDANGAPDVAGYPNPRDAGIITSLLSIVPEHKGFPVMSTAYFRFTDAVPARALTDVITDGSVVLVDIDPSSDELGTTYPVIADTLDVDTYVPTNLVAIALLCAAALGASAARGASGAHGHHHKHAAQASE